MKVVGSIWTLLKYIRILTQYKNGHYIIMSRVHTFGRIDILLEI